MAELSVLKDFDIFFYYDKNDLDIETQSDIMANLIQSKRSLFYNRSLDASGLPDYENKPDGLALRINLPYDIVTSMAKRNQYVTNGENGSKDRRIALSQSTIRIESENQQKGNINISVQYIPMYNFKQSENLKVSLGIQG